MLKPFHLICKKFGQQLLIGRTAFNTRDDRIVHFQLLIPHMSNFITLFLVFHVWFYISQSQTEREKDFSLIFWIYINRLNYKLSQMSG